MIGIKVAGGWLELAPGTITMDISSPFFSTETVPGTITYPFGLPMSPGNLRALNFPHLRADQGEQVADEPAQFFVEGVLRWVGALVYLDADETKQDGMYSYNFVADAADLQSRIEGVSLASLDLGTVALELRHDAFDYALPVLRNSLFYDAEKVPTYGKVVNYHRDGIYQLAYNGKRSPIVPFLRFVPLLRRVLGAFGYQVTGPWLEQEDVADLIIYSDRAAEDANGNVLLDIMLNRFVPDIMVPDLLLDMQKMFGLGYSFHPVRRELRITALRDIIADQQYIERVGGAARTTAVTSEGFTLKMELEDDELNKTLDTGWVQLRIGAGRKVISTGAGTLHVVREADPMDAGRQWLVPAVEAKGASPAFDAGDDSRCGLRLLFDRGMQYDSTGQGYPLATWGRANFSEELVGSTTLRWDGEDGLYATWHQAWLAFLDRATTKERTMQFRVADLLTLEPARKEMVDFRKYLWEKVSLSLKTSGDQLETARFTYRYTRL